MNDHELTWGFSQSRADARLVVRTYKGCQSARDNLLIQIKSLPRGIYINATCNHLRYGVHVVAAIFDAASNVRIADATVTAQVSGLGLAGTKKALETMQIAGTTTYGDFFDLPGRDLYTVKLAIQRPGTTRPVVMDFKYDHRR